MYVNKLYDLYDTYGENGTFCTIILISGINVSIIRDIEDICWILRKIAFYFTEWFRKLLFSREALYNSTDAPDYDIYFKEYITLSSVVTYNLDTITDSKPRL